MAGRRSAGGTGASTPRSRIARPVRTIRPAADRDSAASSQRSRAPYTWPSWVITPRTRTPATASMRAATSGASPGDTPTRPSPVSTISSTSAVRPWAAKCAPIAAPASTLSVASVSATSPASAEARCSLSAPTIGYATVSRRTPASANASASPSFATHSSRAPRAIWSSPICGVRCVLACGARSTPNRRQCATMASRLRVSTSRSTTRAGVGTPAGTGSDWALIRVLLARRVSRASRGRSTGPGRA